ncbi:hypothetical protein L1987_48478 [Smallanthus sonchifolius]|uniref:Uncharacterized protein n=1 Tax=Smallanthus sonchifolius TaxID=185202 RepID=A0ACB9FRR4_9ASTR|nr:hypothetical protein L1987_48478 [Smallanthus sonchifolius]
MNAPALQQTIVNFTAQTRREVTDVLAQMFLPKWTNIPLSLKFIKASLGSITSRNDQKGCKYAFMVDVDWLANMTDIYEVQNMPTVPAVLDWRLSVAMLLDRWFQHVIRLFVIAVFSVQTEVYALVSQGIKETHTCQVVVKQQWLHYGRITVVALGVTEDGGIRWWLYELVGGGSVAERVVVVVSFTAPSVLAVSGRFGGGDDGVNGAVQGGNDGGSGGRM